ncbi:MAG TPA: sialate O-acetylesterase [Flavilitoribacter sp.]|nr:sialate O-acetylesterase [Flavilitoribacter sp.]
MPKKLLFLFFLTGQLFAQISLPKLVSDGAILQRDEPLKLWGYASPAEKITVALDGKQYKTKADAQGNWALTLPPHPAGGPFEMQLKGKNTLTVKDLLFGDVWLCTGQSNMVLTMERVKEKYPDEIASADNPEIRNFFIKTMTDLQSPRVDFPDGKWVAASPETVLQFGAVAYFFAKELYEQYRVPIGIINASVGGTPIQAWISENGLREFEDLQTIITRNKDEAYVKEQLAENRRHTLIRPNEDKGLLEAPKWYETDYQPNGWRNIHIPGYWEDQGLGKLDGVVWYRREIDVPADMCGKAARLFMGRIVDADHIYVNGQQVGNITYQYPPRRYIVPAGVLKPGKNTIVIRVQNQANKGGFVPDKPYALTTGDREIDLKGDWQYKVGQAYEPVPAYPAFSAQNQPASLFNAMTSPVVAQTAVKGVTWYQGESNAGDPRPYAGYLKALIHDYRNRWHREDLPFLYVQLANFMDRNFLPAESNWAELRNAQLQALELPRTAMAVAIDLGEWNDIHPLNKKDVGQRLALGARALAYGEKDLPYSGPVYKSFEIEGPKMILYFDHTDGGLKSADGEPLNQFAIAGEGRQFVWADARIAGNTVEVSSDKISSPRFVRYAWSDNPEGANLYNGAGLPASPFEAGENQDNLLWHGKKAAVVLTYDDALEVHLDNVIPVLDSLGFKSTFYLSAAFPGSKNRLEDWKKAARNGHELGNHLLYHPCDASKPGRSWVSPLNDLSKYTTAQLVRESDMTNTFLESLDGRKERTFAYTCGDTETGEGSFIDAIKDQFVALRGVRGQLNTVENLNLLNVDCYAVDDSNADQLQVWAEQAKQENALLVILFHGVGGGHNINVSLEKHNQFLKYLKENQQDFWVATMLDAAKNSIPYIKK